MSRRTSRSSEVSGARTGAGVGKLPSSETLCLITPFSHLFLSFFITYLSVLTVQRLPLSAGSGVQPGDRPSGAGVGELGWRLHLHQPERCPPASAGVWQQRQAVRHVRAHAHTHTHNISRALSHPHLCYLSGSLKASSDCKCLNTLGLITSQQRSHLHTELP